MKKKIILRSIIVILIILNSFAVYVLVRPNTYTAKLFKIINMTINNFK